jgi:hypothetical protein
MNKLVYAALAVIMLSSVAWLSSCGSAVSVTVSNSTHIDLTVTVEVNSGDGSITDFGFLSSGQSIEKTLPEGWLDIRSISVEGANSAGVVVYHRDYTLLEVRTLNGFFEIDEQPSYFSIS